VPHALAYRKGMTEREIPERLSSLPSWLLMEAAARAARIVAERTAQNGVPKAAYPILAVLQAAGPLSQAEVGRRLRIDRKDLSGHSTRLEQLGLVTRRADPSDARRNLLENTSEGSELLERLDPDFAAAQDEWLARLSTAERRTLKGLLELITVEDVPGECI
jgi:DNA-binding MarR family transcriptional regulator